jgi:hypothetical protein
VNTGGYVLLTIHTIDVHSGWPREKSAHIKTVYDSGMTFLPLYRLFCRGLLRGKSAHILGLFFNKGRKECPLTQTFALYPLSPHLYMQNKRPAIEVIQLLPTVRSQVWTTPKHAHHQRSIDSTFGESAFKTVHQSIAPNKTSRLPGQELP